LLGGDDRPLPKSSVKMRKLRAGSSARSHGGYYHPDNVAVHRATTAAFFSSGAMGSEAPEHARGVSGVRRRQPRQRHHRWSGPDVFGAAPEIVAVSFDARPYLDRKLSVLTAHRSAFGVTLDTLKNPPPGAAQMLQAFRPVLEREVFLLGGARGAVPRWPLGDFFDGLETPAIRTVDMDPVRHDVPA
jgi:N-acetyl-1-D-myo-inositol-2-amino-2-deoxy-alpha-D-glucopyranoside deacetylase